MGHRAVSLSRHWCRIILVVACCGSSTGCQTVRYYHQAARGQWQILRERQPISDVIVHPATSHAVKEKLQLVLQIRDFARDQLDLPVDGQYERYVHLNRRFAVWNVHAAPRYSLCPKTWYYPVVGSLKYRGYFSETEARAYARGWEEDGYDVYVHGVEAYSTLGWFEDPVLSTFIHHKKSDLAEILFHELAHQKIFVPGDTDFNEAFATAVAEVAVRRWLGAHGTSDEREAYEASLRRNEQFVGLLLDARRRLETLYQSPRSPYRQCQRCRSIDRAALQAEKEKILTELRDSYRELRKTWNGFAGYDHWFDQPLNNAQLNTVSSYYQLVPAFHELLHEQGDVLTKFYQAVKVLGKQPKQERHQHLNDLRRQPSSLKRREVPAYIGVRL